MRYIKLDPVLGQLVETGEQQRKDHHHVTVPGALSLSCVILKTESKM